MPPPLRPASSASRPSPSHRWSQHKRRPAPSDRLAAAQQSIGVVRIGERERSSTGWIAADGLVVTSDIIASEPGEAVTFTTGSAEPVACYTAVVERALHLAYLRCAELEGVALRVATGYPAPGVGVTVALATPAGDAFGVTTEAGAVTANDIAFMGANRLQFSMWVNRSEQPAARPGILDSENSTGAPVLDAEGRVISTILTSPDAGGQPIGTTPSELAKGVKKAAPLPATISSAAVLTVARRALIPAAVGLVLGLIWAMIARNGNILAKTLGLTALGLVGAVAYTLFTLLVVGPQTLIG
ncbi:MAG: hypothetical protein V9G12_00670 [Microthrixaceae bacterium]